MTKLRPRRQGSVNVSYGHGKHTFVKHSTKLHFVPVFNIVLYGARPHGLLSPFPFEWKTQAFLRTLLAVVSRKRVESKNKRAESTGLAVEPKPSG